MKMKEAGFKRLSYGVESGSQTILDLMQKKTKDNYKTVSLMKEVGMSSSVNIVFSIPGETVETMDESKDFLVSLDLTSKDYATLATPYTGSPLFQHALEKGIIKDTREYLSDLGEYADYRYNLTDMPRIKFLKKSYRSCL